MGLYSTSVLISFAIQSFVLGDLSKCCPLYQELSLENSRASNFSRHDFTCELSTGSTLSATYTQLKIDLPECQQIRLVSAYERNSKIACMDRIGQLNDVYGLVCVDELDPEQIDSRMTTKRRMSITSINSLDHQVHKNQTDNDDINSDWLLSTQPSRQHNSFSIPPITNVRKCCPAQRKYAAERQFCWSEFSSDNNRTLLDLPKLSVRHPDRFVQLTFGMPPCHSNAVLVDTVVPSDLVNFTGDALMLNNTQYSFDEYCVDLVDDKFEYLVVRACQDQLTQCHFNGHLCVRKCCPAGQEIQDQLCVPSNRSLKLFFHNVTNRHSSPLIVPIEATPAFVFGNPCKEGKFMLDPDDVTDSHVLTASGSVFMQQSKLDLDRNNYCIDNYKSGTMTFRCFPSESKEVDENVVTSMIPTMTLTCMATSAVFLLVTFFVYLMLPSLHNLHGKLIMCYLLTSALSYSAVVVSIMLQNKRYKSVGRLPKEMCITLGYIMQFTFLSSFSWLNIISYDIWSTFKVVRSAFLKKSNTFKRFSMFCLYGWGSSLLWTGLTLLCQYTSIISDQSSWKPDIGATKCFFSSTSTGKLVFFVAPVLTMISFNVIIFIFTVKYCASIRAELKKSNNNYSLKRYSADKNDHFSSVRLLFNYDTYTTSNGVSPANRNRLVINLKLFIVMGLNWSMELISVLVKPHNEIFFFTSDLMNALGGVFIFCIFVLKRKVLMELKAKICGKKPKSRNFERATGFTTSTSSSIVMNFMNSRRSVSLNP